MRTHERENAAHYDVVMADRTTADERLFRDVMDSLPGLGDRIWSELTRARESSKHGWHLPMVGTGGQQPHVRTVVLRDVDRTAGTIACHTDARSPKVTQIRMTPHASWCFYDHANRVQLVADGIASVHTGDAVADAGWDRSTVSSRRCYLAPAAPGAELDGPQPNLPPHLVGKLPEESELGPGRENFAVIQTRVERLDFLFLAFDGNLRAEFVRDDDAFTGRWIAA